MYKLGCENNRGEMLQLSQNEDFYIVEKVEGLSPVKSNIITTSMANFDGEFFKHARLEMRNIVITLRIKGDVENNRVNLYEFFNTKDKIKLHYENDHRRVSIEGYCENFECDLFTQNETAQISIICPSPYWESMEEIITDISKKFSNFEFPFSIPYEGVELSSVNLNKNTLVINGGDVETGIIIEIESEADGIRNPIIYNADTGDFIKINEVLNDGEKIIIDTNKGKKSIIKIVDGMEYNIINDLDLSSKWLQLKKGNQFFTYSADSLSEELIVTIKRSNKYSGV